MAERIYLPIYLRGKRSWLNWFNVNQQNRIYIEREFYSELYPPIYDSLFDNKSPIRIAHNLVQHDRTKH